MKLSLLALALAFSAACAADAGGADESPRGEASSTADESGWWVEIEAAELGTQRAEGWLVVTSIRAGRTSSVQVRQASRDNRSGFSITLPDFPGEPGSLANQMVTVSYGGEPAYTCRARQMTVDVESVEPFSATFEGTGLCWEGDSAAPEDPENPGQALPGFEATLRGSVVE